MRKVPVSTPCYAATGSPKGAPAPTETSPRAPSFAAARPHENATPGRPPLPTISRQRIQRPVGAFSSARANKYRPRPRPSADRGRPRGGRRGRSGDRAAARRRAPGGGRQPVPADAGNLAAAGYPRLLRADLTGAAAARAGLGQPAGPGRAGDPEGAAQRVRALLLPAALRRVRRRRRRSGRRVPVGPAHARRRSPGARADRVARPHGAAALPAAVRLEHRTLRIPVQPGDVRIPRRRGQLDRPFAQWRESPDGDTQG